MTNDEYAQVGRVVVSAARLEHLIAAFGGFLLRALGDIHEQEEEAAISKFWAQVVGDKIPDVRRGCKKLARRLPDSVLTLDRLNEFVSLLDSTDGPLSRRHAVAHGYWDRADNGDLIATRPNRLKDAVPGPGVDHLRKNHFAPGELSALADELDGVTLRLAAYRDEIWPEPW